MPAHLLSSDISLALALEEITYTHARLTANPLTAALASDFDVLLQDWKKTNDQEIQLRTAIVNAGALIAACDDELDELVDAVSQGVLLSVKNDRKAPAYELYFGNQRPNELKRPMLGGQLEKMRAWIPSLQASTSKILTQLGATLAQKVAAADTAIATQASAEQKNRDFRTVGERKALIDALNAARKLTYGKLSELPHASPDEHLPATFGEPFFRHESVKKAPKPETPATLTAEIATREAELAEVRARLAHAIEEERTLAKQKSEADAIDAEIAAAEQAATEAVARLAALKAKKKN